jgi:hypothetical protein
MTTPGSILMFGHDPQLLKTRSWILNGDGFEVDCVTTLRELQSHLASHHYRLLVLCHSLSGAERSVATSLTTPLAPELKLLLLETCLLETIGPPLTQVPWTDTDPGRFRSAVHSLAPAE